MSKAAPKKLALFLMSVKGGVGKTTVARAITALCREHGVKLVAIDADAKVGQLAAFEGLRGPSGRYDAQLNEEDPTKGVLKIDIHNKRDRARLPDAMDLNEPALLHDLPGGSVDEMRDIFGNIDSFIDEYHADGYEICIMLVINQLLASSAAIPEIVKVWGKRVRYVVVKNSSSASTSTEPSENDAGPAPFLFFDGAAADRAGNPAALIKSLGGQVLEMPRLDEDTYALIDADQMPFGLAASPDARPAGYEPAEPYGRTDRARVRNFLRVFGERVGQLGLIPGFAK